MKNAVYRENGLEYVFLDESYLEELLDFTDDVCSRIEDVKTFARDTREDFMYVFSGNGKILGVFLDDKLVAYRNMGIIPYEESLAVGIKPVEIPREKIVQHDAVLVHEVARGKNIQNITRKILEKSLENEGYNYYMSTVAPSNIYSLRNTINNGFVIVGLENKYADEENVDGLIRFIFYKSKHEKLEYSKEEVFIPIHNYEEIRNILSQGYVGTELENDKIKFVKLNKKVTK
ncbi:hypothetical protein [Peptoniphilus mikwangii]|uniref:hypothetical protein n=1 Tax=Peptoniphilus mikwangii TaxID=1354300 RepID=UPI0003FFD8C8|nr:hypothetical protein [Peptoniphilus mikwangii]